MFSKIGQSDSQTVRHSESQTFGHSGIRAFGVSGKKGQVGETVTWVIATVIIVVVLMLFVFGATTLGSTKSIGNFKPSLFSVEIGVGDDQFLKKSLFTYVKTEDSSTKKLIDRSLNKSYVDYGFGLSYEDVKNEIVRRYESGKN